MELIVNGVAVDTADVAADGRVRDVKFSCPVAKSGWMALRIYASSHSNPVFVEVDNKPVDEKKSARMVHSRTGSMLENEGTEYSGRGEESS